MFVEQKLKNLIFSITGSFRGNNALIFLFICNNWLYFFPEVVRENEEIVAQHLQRLENYIELMQQRDDVHPVDDVPPVANVHPVDDVPPVANVHPVDDVPPVANVHPVDDVPPVANVHPVLADQGNPVDGDMMFMDVDLLLPAAVENDYDEDVNHEALEHPDIQEDDDDDDEHEEHGGESKLIRDLRFLKKENKRIQIKKQLNFLSN